VKSERLSLRRAGVALAFGGIVAAATSLSRATATKALLYQLAVSALVLPLASVLAASWRASPTRASWWPSRATSPGSGSSLGRVFLSEPISAAGIVLVNLRR
jgi:hypothetical protein